MSVNSPYDAITPESIKADILADLTDSGAAVDTRAGTYADQLVSETAYQIWKVYQQLALLLEAAFPGPDSGPYIDAAAAMVGMERKVSAKATVELHFVGGNRIDIPAGTVCYSSRTGLCYQTLEDAVTSSHTADIRAEAAESGAQYNLEAMEIDSFKTPFKGIGTVINLTAASGGSDAENDAEFWARWHARMSLPATSGNAAQYVGWALETPGVAYAACIPVWDGPNTVKVIVAGPGKAAVSQTIIDACKAYIETRRPIGAEVTVASAAELQISLVASVTLETGTSVEAVEAELTQRVTAMLEALEFGAALTIPYSKFLGCLLSCSGVADYSGLTVNGDTANITVQAGQVPTLDGVEVTAS